MCKYLLLFIYFYFGIINFFIIFINKSGDVTPYKPGDGGSSDDNSSSTPTKKYKTTTDAIDEYYKSGAIKAKKQNGSLLSRFKKTLWKY